MIQMRKDVDCNVRSMYFTIVNITERRQGAFLYSDMKKRRNEMLEKAKQLASQEFSRLSDREIKAEDCFVVWFSKTLQNWKALVSTNAITSSEPCGNYAEITHNGDKNETYVDVYAKVSNRVIKD